MDLQVVEKPVGSLHFKVCWLTLIYFFSSEKITAFICSGILFTKNLYHIETSQFVFIANQLSGFYILRDFTERYFGKGYSYSVTMSFIYNLFFIYSFFGLFIWNRSYYKHFAKDGWLRKLIFEFSSGSKIFDLKHSTVFSMFQIKLCDRYNL